MFQLLKQLFTKKPSPKVESELPSIYEYVIVGRWPFTDGELKQWQDQWDKPYNPLNIDFSICIPNGYVDRDGNILTLKKKATQDHDIPTIRTTEELNENLAKFIKDTADRHGEGKPNGY